jgi:hypothetical protein
VEEKHMSHLRNIVGAIEDKGYAVLSIRYEDGNVAITVENPYFAGNLAFLEKTRDQEGLEQKRLMTREEYEALPPEQKDTFQQTPAQLTGI